MMSGCCIRQEARPIRATCKVTGNYSMRQDTKRVNEKPHNGPKGKRKSVGER